MRDMARLAVLLSTTRAGQQNVDDRQRHAASVVTFEAARRGAERRGAEASQQRRRLRGRPCV